MKKKQLKKGKKSLKKKGLKSKYPEMGIHFGRSVSPLWEAIQKGHYQIP